MKNVETMFSKFFPYAQKRLGFDKPVSVNLVSDAENAKDLQSLITIVNLWCCKFRLEANLTKTEIMHVRKPSVPQSKFKFKFGARAMYTVRREIFKILLNK